MLNHNEIWFTSYIVFFANCNFLCRVHPFFAYLTICLWCCKVLKWAGEKFTAWLTYECLVIGLPPWCKRSGWRPVFEGWSPSLRTLLTLPLASRVVAGCLSGWVFEPGDKLTTAVACAEVAKWVTFSSSKGLMCPEVPFSYKEIDWLTSADYWLFWYLRHLYLFWTLFNTLLNPFVHYFKLLQAVFHYPKLSLAIVNYLTLS